VTVIALMAMGALLASSASASIVSAKFSSPSFRFVGSGPITLKRNGIEPKTCELKSVLEGGNLSSQSDFSNGNGTFGEARFECAGTLEMFWYGAAYYDTVTGAYSLRVSDFPSYDLNSPYGRYYQQSEGKNQGGWTNGSGTTASRVTFKEAMIGRDLAGKAITLTGTLKVTTPSGGLVTLSH
jgi:hypothetical protein